MLYVSNSPLPLGSGNKLGSDCGVALVAAAEGDLTSKNLKPHPQASWVGPPAVAGNVARTDPTAGVSASHPATVLAVGIR